MSLNCPTCHRNMTPVRAVVLGVVDRDDAPILVDAWQLLVSNLNVMGDEYVLRTRLIAVTSEWTEASPKTLENLLRAAVHVDLIEVDYRDEGTPRRRRAYVRLSHGAG